MGGFMRRAVLATVLLSACGGHGSTRPDGGTGGEGGGSGAGLFDACGGLIFAGGTFSAAEYEKQATKWDRAAIDCRLGPKFAHYHPNDDDSGRPTAPELPLTPNAGGYLCPAFDHDTPGPAGYGSTSGQVAYAPDQVGDPGLDRLQTVGWEGSGQCYQPLQSDHLGGAHPDGAISQWTASGIAPGVPIAKARTEHGETGDGVVIFSNGLVGTTGTQTSGSSHPTAQLPAHKVPTAVSVTNYNELALVTVWDTKELKGQVAVFALRAGKPEAFSIHLFAAPNEGGFDAIQLLGYVDLPGMKTPTSISATGNNTGRDGHPWVDDPSNPHAYQGVGTIFADLSWDGMLANSALYVWVSDPKSGPGLFGNAGGAMIASAWEDEVVFLDLAPLFTFVRKVYVDPIANKTDQALYTQATAAGPWPFDFTTNPEMMPKVVATISVPHPTVVRLGLAPRGGQTGFASKLLGWVGALDGHVALFDASSLAGQGSADPIAKLTEVQADPNPTSLHLTNNNDAAFLVSRGNRSVQWLSAGAAALTVDRTFRDARVDDPVATDNNQRVGNLVTIGDFSSGQVLDFESSCPSDGGACTYAFDGALAFPGKVYLVDTANVN
jgi:hypothetical protein